jgi:hypothetical protein
LRVAEAKPRIEHSWPCQVEKPNQLNALAASM